MGNFYQKIDRTISSFTKGIVSRVDRRDVAEDSLADCVGFNLSEVYGQLKKDFGSSSYLDSLPLGLVAILGFDVLKIESLGNTFAVLVGVKSDFIPRVYVRGYYDVQQKSGYSDVWVELTEKVSGTIASIPTADYEFEVTGLDTDVADSYYVGWIAYNTTRGDASYVSASEGATAYITVDEQRSNWQTSDVVDLYRYPDVLSLGLLTGDVVSDVAEAQVSFNTVGDKMGIAVQRNAGVSEVPLQVSVVDRQWFFSGTNFQSPKYQKLHLAREIHNTTDLESLGLSMEIERDESTLYIPEKDMAYDYDASSDTGFRNSDGKNPSTAPPGDMYTYIDDGVLGDGTTYVQAILKNTSVGGSTALRSASYDVGFESSGVGVTIPSAGTIWVTVRAKGSPHDQLWMSVQIIEYSNPTGVNPQIVPRGEPVRWDKINSSWQDYTMGKTVEELSFTGNPAWYGVRITFGCDFISFLGTATGNIDTVRSVIATQTTSKRVRLAFVPQYDGYLLGRPVEDEIAFDGSGTARYYPRLTADFARMDKRLTDVFVFTDDGDGSRDLGSFRSAWEFKLTTAEINSAGLPFNKVCIWENRTQPWQGTGTATINGTTAVVGVNTHFLSEVSVGDYIITSGESRRVVKVTSDTSITVATAYAGSATAVFYILAPPNKRYRSQSSSGSAALIELAGSDRPATLQVGRATTGLITLSEFLGYGIAGESVDILPNYRYQVQMGAGQASKVVVDESDTVLRTSVYSSLVHNDHTFPKVVSDLDGVPLMMFLAEKGELMGLFSQLGNLYAYKRTSVTIIDGASTAAYSFKADVVSKRGIVQTAHGIVHCGVHGVYVMPVHGGLLEDITDPIREDWAAISTARKQNIVVGDCPEMGVTLITIPDDDTPSDEDPTAYTTWVYHHEGRMWWKRQFERPPARYTKLYDNTLVYASILNGAQEQGSGTIQTVGSAVTGVGTTFTTEAAVGWLIKVIDMYREITEIAGKFALTMASPFDGDDIPPGTNYYIVRPALLKYPDRTVYTDDGEGVYWRIETQWLQLGSQLQKTLNNITLAAQDATGGAVNFKISIFFDRSDTAYSTITGVTLGNSSRFTEEIAAIAQPNSFREVKVVIERDPAYTQLQATGKFDVSEIRLIGESHSTGREY